MRPCARARGRSRPGRRGRRPAAGGCRRPARQGAAAVSSSSAPVRGTTALWLLRRPVLGEGTECRVRLLQGSSFASDVRPITDPGVDAHADVVVDG